MASRNPYLVTQALKTFMWGSILAAVSSQLATTTDAIVVSNLIGPAAISAINLMTPVLTVFSCLMILFGIGASIIAAKAIGRRDENSANGVFTAAIISSAGSGVLLAILTFLFSPFIVRLLSGGNEEIYPLALSYLQVMCVAVPFMMMAGVIENFVKIDGRPRIVMTAVIIGSCLNLILDIVFVKWLHMGIAGSAWATGINYLVAILVCFWHFRSPYNSLKWHPDWKMMKSYVNQSVSQGMPMSLNTLLLGGCILLINYIVLYAQGADGIYCWSVCLQLFMIMQMVLTGIGSSIYSIGGILVGEQDMEGLSILNRKSVLYTVAALTVVTVVILIFPEFFGELFGSRSDNPIEILPYALRAFSIMLVPYVVVALLRSTYQILGRIGLSLFLSIFQLALMVGFVFAFSFISPFVMWWGFPSSSVALLIGLCLYTVYLHYKYKDLRYFTLIPKMEDSESISISVKMNPDSVNEADKKVSEFLKHQSIDDLTNYKVRLNCEELMHNILNHAVTRKKEKHYFDLSIRILKDSVNVLLKDDGRPFNPILSCDKIDLESESVDQLGLKLVNCTADSINYKYMYDQNVVTLNFIRQQ
ncbi:MAG: ATP-binding protein [Muribaculaceae bacterium]|nr:ATP-binding protein [Muribaculaceae bacterium]